MEYSMKIFQLHILKSNPRAPNISLTNSSIHPLQFQPGRNTFELKRLVSVCSTQLSVELYKLYVCRLVWPVLQEWQKCFEGKHVLRTEHGGKRYLFLHQFLHHIVMRINTCGIYKRNTVNNTGYWKATTRWVPKVKMCCDIAHIRALSECYKSAIKY